MSAANERFAASGGAPSAVGHQVGTLPPVSSLFAAVLGVNPLQHLLASSGALSSLPTANQHVITGKQFFPNLISGPFHQGLVVVFAVAAALAALAALASFLRGGRYIDPGAPYEALLMDGTVPVRGWDFRPRQ